jgi:Flp pilus assembly protein CpaB
MRGNKNKKKIIVIIVVGMIPVLIVLNIVKSLQAQNEALAQKMSQQPAPTAAPPPPADPMVSTIQAKSDIKSGEVITIAKLETKQYKKSELPLNCYNLASLVLGKIAGKAILQGKIITSDDILDVDPNLVNIPAGMRAITIPTSAIQGLAKYIFVGSRIDILSVKTPPEFIAQNVKIISLEGAGIDPALQPVPPAPAPPPVVPGAAPVPAPVVPVATTSSPTISADKAIALTVLVPIESVNKLVEGIVGGKLQVITRGPGDNKIVRRSYSSSSTPKVSLPPPPTSISKLPTIPSGPIDDGFEEEPKSKVEIITANNKTSVCFDNQGNQMKNCSGSKPKTSSFGAPDAAIPLPLPNAPQSKSLNDLLKMMK